MKNANRPSLLRTLAATSCGLIASVLLTACAPPTYVPPVLPPLVYPKPPDEARFFHERTIRSSADIVIDSEESQMMRFMTGVQRTGVGLGKPFGIAVHKNLMWVTDPGSRKILVFDSKNRRYRTVGTTQPGMLRKPYDIETDNQGNAYVMDGTLKAVMVYNADGQFVKTIGAGSDFNLPSYLAVNADGSKVFVVDTGGVTSQKHEVIVFDTATGKELYRFGKRGSDPGEVNLPKDITIAPDNRIYLVDSGNFRVNVYEEDGTFVKSFGSIGLRLGTFSRPKGIATDSEGRVYVTDAAFGNFQIFNADGQLLMFIGERSARGARGEFFLPSGIAVDSDGRVYMVDQYHQKVEVFRPAALPEEAGEFALQTPPQAQ